MKKGIFKSLLLSLAIFCGFNLISTVNNTVENNEFQTIENRKINIKKSSTMELTVTKDYYFKAEDTNTVKATTYSYLCGDITVEISNPYNPPLKDFVEGNGLTIWKSTLVKVKAKEKYNIVSISLNSLSSGMSYYLNGNIVSNPKPESTDNDKDGVYNWTCILLDGSKDASFYVSAVKKDFVGFSVTYKYNHTHNPTWHADETHHWKECECGLSEYNTEKVPHNLIENEELSIAPDHISSGTKFYECECGKDVTEKEPPLGHDWDGTWYYNETHHWKQCSETHETMEFDKAEHVWLFKNTVNEPTVDEIGKAIYYCESCNKEKKDLSYLNLTDEKIRIEASNLLTYTGKEQFQGVNVYYGETKLNLNEHYILNENNQTNAGNYTLKITGTGTFRGETTFDYTISKAPLKVIVDNKTVTYGEVEPIYTVSYDGFVEGENETLLTGELSFKCNYAQFSDVGEYVISVENGYNELANYNIEYIDGTLSVNPKLITLEWENTSLTYNGEGQKPVASFIGLVNGDSCDAIVSGAQTNVGTYIAIANGLTNPNYVLSSSVSTEYTIEPKSIEGAVVTLKDTLVYTGSELTQEVESVILDGTTLIKDVDYVIKNNTGKNVNTYTLTVEGKGNYKGSVTKDFEIIKQKVNLPTANTNLVYTGTEVTGVSASNLYDVVDGTAVNAGPHTATVTLKDSSNYEWAEEFDGTVEYSISKAPLTITAESKEVTYGDIVPTYTVSYNGLVNNETSSVLGGTLSFVSSYSQTSNVGKYDIAASGLTSENYEITYVDGKVIVSQKEVGLTWGETQFTYNGSSQLPTVTLTGLVNNDTCEVTVTGKQINAGSYVATATALSNENYKLPVNVTTDYVINKATHDMSGVSFNDVTLTYDGNEHEVVLDGTLPSGVEVTYSTNKGTNVGTYNAVATFSYDKVNYNAISDMNAVLTINKATYDMSGISFNDVTVTYDGNEYEVVLDGTLPTGVEVTYSTNKGTNAGTYNAVATFTYDAENYNVIENKTATLTINKATYDMSGVSFENVTVTYDGNEHEVVVDGTLPSGVEVTYTTNKGTNAGTYNAVAKFTYDEENYNAIPNKTATLTINKATYDMSGVSFNDVTVTYDGNEYILEIDGQLPEGVSVSYTTNKLINVGTIEVVASFTGNSNYHEIPNKTATLTISKATHDMSGVSFNDVTVTYDGSEHEVVLDGTLPSGVTVTYSTNKGTNVGTYNAVATFSYDAENYNVIADMNAVLTISKATHDMSGVSFNDVTVTYDGSEHEVVLDGTLPSGVEVTYSTNKGTNVGTYNAVATFSYDTENYNVIENKTATLTVKQAQAVIDVDENDIEVVYGDKLVIPVASTNFGEVEIEKVDMTNTGEYTIKYKVEETSNYKGDIIEVKVIVKPLAVSEPTLKGTYTYNGNDQTVELNGLESFMTIASGNKATNAGNYEVVITLDDNHVWKEGSDGKIAWSIEKATYDMSGVSFNDVTVTYDGNEHEVVIDGTLPSGVEVTYSTNKGTNAGVYNAVATFSYDAENYNVIENKTATLTINKAKASITVDTNDINVIYGDTITLPEGTTNFGEVVVNRVEMINVGEYKVTYDVASTNNYDGDTKEVKVIISPLAVSEPTVKGTYTYNGNEQTVELNGLESSFMTIVSGNKATNAGSYEVVITLDDNHVWKEGSDGKIAWSIEKATYDMSGVSFENVTVTYDGNEHEVVLDGTLPSGVTVTYSTNKGTNAGVYNAVATFTYDAENYNVIENKTATLTINKATYDMSGVSFNDVTVTYDGSEHEVVLEGTLPSGVEVTYSTNKGTKAGTYNAVATFSYDAENYNVIENKTATLTINKAQASITVDTNDINVIYGDTITLPEGTTNFGEVVVTRVDMINVGEYKVTYDVASTNNYDGDTKEVKVIISPLAVSEPIVKGTYTYNGNEQTVELNGLESSFMTIVSGNKATNAGNYEVVITLDDNHVWKEGSDGKIAWSIEKATYDMSGVSFNDVTVVENGENQALTITGTLPNGVTVTYSLTECIEPGVYEIVASFIGDANNYNAIPSMKANLTIKQSKLEPETNFEEGHENDVIVSSPEGIDPNKHLVIEMVEVVQDENDYSNYLEKNQKAAIGYEIKLLDENNIESQPDGTLVIKILIPEGLREREFGIMHIHSGNQKTMMKYTIEEEYAVIHTDKLSEFVFVYETGSILWLIIVLGVLALLEAGLLVYLILKAKQINGIKTHSVIPPFVFGMFVLAWEIVMVIVLIAIVVALAVIDIIYALKLLKARK